MPAAAFQSLLNRDFTAKSEVYCEYSAAVGQNSSLQQHPMQPALSLRQHLFSNLRIEVNNGGAGTIDSFSASSAAVNNRRSNPKPGTTRMRLFLNQAERMGVPQMARPPDLTILACTFYLQWPMRCASFRTSSDQKRNSRRSLAHIDH